MLFYYKPPRLLPLYSNQKQTKHTIKQNFMWALGYNVMVLPFAIMGVLTPWQARWHVVSSLIVVYNSARLLVLGKVTLGY